jgi:hypothetical protein
MICVSDHKWSQDYGTMFPLSGLPSVALQKIRHPMSSFNFAPIEVIVVLEATDTIDFGWKAESGTALVRDWTGRKMAFLVLKTCSHCCGQSHLLHWSHF